MKNIVLVSLIATCLAAPQLAAQESKPAPQRDTKKERLDRNDDGKVGPRERDAARKDQRNDERKDGRKPAADGWCAEWQSFASKHPDAATRIKAKADTDGNGEISATERSAAHAALTKWRHEHLQEDWQHFLEEHPEAAKKMRAAVDKDGDGKVDDAERELVHKRMQEIRAECREKAQQRAEQDPKVAEKTKERADKNDDGKVGPRERQRAGQQARERRDERRERRDG